MSRVDPDKRSNSVLTMNEVQQRLGGISGISHEKSRMEFTIGKPSFTENIGCSLTIMDISRTDVSSDRESIIFAVSKQVEFPRISHLFGALCSLFDTPARLGISLRSLSSVTPSFKSSRVQAHPFPKARQLIVSPNQSTGDIFDQMEILWPCQLRKEARESGFVRNTLWTGDTASLRNKRVISEYTDQGLSGWKPQNIFSQEAMPQNLWGMSFRTSSSRAYEGGEQRIIGNISKESFKFCNDRRGLNRGTKGGSIIVDHWEVVPSFWLGDVGANHAYVSAFLCYFILELLYYWLAINVKRF